jgi:hypothetical protein
MPAGGAHAFRESVEKDRLTSIRPVGKWNLPAVDIAERFQRAGTPSFSVCPSFVQKKNGRADPLPYSM